MRQAAPDKQLIPAPVETEQGSCQSCGECPHMKRNTIEKMYLALKDLAPEIVMDEELRKRAWLPLKRMLDLS